jgi:protocatechuate 3,4-dioxygenase beta subunit
MAIDPTSRRAALKILAAAGAAAMGCGGSESNQSNSGGQPSTAGRAGAGATGGGTIGSGGNGNAAGALGTGGGSAGCLVRPTQTEGPYFVDELLNRSDIRSDPSTGTVSEGLPLRIVMRVYRVGGEACIPVVGATVDLWQCDALGIYSDVLDGGGAFDTTGQKFLRGFQLTDETGTAEFLTIYPGWYSGRTVHIHFKVRTDPAASTGLEFTSQLYFDDAITDLVMSQAPYVTNSGTRVRNAQDGIFASGGSELMLELEQASQGYVGTFDIGLALA